MAIYHCSIKIISRGKGKSAVAASAYRSGEIIRNMYDGIIHDFTRKRGIVHTEIMLPPHASPDFKNRSILWNSVEQIEKSKNSQLAREIEVALPVELSRDKQIELVRKYVEETFVSAGMCADFAIHDKNDGNPHAHILLTMRPLQESGEWGAKSRKEYVLDKTGQRIKLKNGNYKTYKVDTTDWNKQENAEVWRKAWADITNKYLEVQKSEERIDHRSYKRQRIEQIPTIHLGVAVSQMQKRGIETEHGKRNQRIREQNRLLKEVKRRIGRLMKWIKENRDTPAKVPSGEVVPVPSVLERLEKAKKEVADKGESQILINENTLAEKEFIRKHNITTYGQFAEMVQELKIQYQTVGRQIKRMEKQIHDKQELIEQSEKYMRYREYYKTSKQMGTGKKEAYQMKHRNEIALYEHARNYLLGHLGNETKVSPKEWKKEIKVLMNKKDSLYLALDKLKAEASEAENIRQSIAHESGIQRQCNHQKKNNGLEL